LSSADRGIIERHCNVGGVEQARRRAYGDHRTSMLVKPSITK